MSNVRLPSCLLCVCLLIGSLAHADETIDFVRDVRPILSNHCYRCHGPDEEKLEAGLRLDTPPPVQAEKSSSAIIPGQPDTSEVVLRVKHADPELRMPPVEAGRALTPAEIATLERWIEQGARYEQHWAFRPVRRPEVPGSPSQSAWVRNPIDAFVLQKLEALRITPAPEADRETLLRRVSLDLLGLPPTLEEIEAFLADTSPQAYEQMVDRLLASPHYGERWGRHWLDQARYADTNGYTIDSERSIWPYRDWVIQALNEDKSFAEFTVEQLAGDLLPNPTRDQLIATGFHRNTLVNQEGGTDAEQFRNEAVVDRVNTTGAVWLGLTVGCAQCHNHKYDPLTLREYYQLFAFFNSGQDVNQVTPTLSLPSPEQQAQLAALDSRLRKVREEFKASEQQQQSAEPSGSASTFWETPEGPSVHSEAGAGFEALEDRSWLVSGNNGDSDTYTITLATRLERITAVKLETLTHASLPKQGPGRAGNGNFVLNEIELRTGQETANWTQSRADHSQSGYPVEHAIDGKPETGWAINVSQGSMNVNRSALFLCKPMAVPAQGGVTLSLVFGDKPAGYNIGRFRISLSDRPADELLPGEVEKSHYEKTIAELEAERKKLQASIASTMIMRDLPHPRETRVLIRGDFLRPADLVIPGTPAMLNPLEPAHDDIPLNRLDLARWLVDRENPLTARVFVNRAWSHYFPRGLVETENDFGMQGSLPTHPELLDWLSAEFMESGWSMKGLHRMIVTSATYRQSSLARPELEEIDPDNKLLARQSRLRVDAEIVRDLGLSVSGLLHPRIGAPSVYPPQPDGVYDFTQRRANWPTSTGPDRYRRGMYTFFMRSAPHPLLTTFDTPGLSTTCTSRTRSNTPLQALTLANDAAMQEVYRAFGARLRERSASDEDRIRHGYRLCFTRLPDDEEFALAQSYLNRLRRDFAGSPEEARLVMADPDAKPEVASESATWVMLARLLMNLDEFITRE